MQRNGAVISKLVRVFWRENSNVNLIKHSQCYWITGKASNVIVAVAFFLLHLWKVKHGVLDLYNCVEPPQNGKGNWKCCSIHIARSWPISTLASHFCMLTPTGWNVSKLFFGFLPLSSCWRRNFLGKHFAFLATRKQLPSQAASLCPQTSFLFCCWPTNCSPGNLAGKEWSRRWWLTSSEAFGHLAKSFTACVEFLTKKRTPLLKKMDLRMWERPDTYVGWYGVSTSGELRLPDPTDEARKLSSDTGRILSK